MFIDDLFRIAPARIAECRWCRRYRRLATGRDVCLVCDAHEHGRPTRIPARKAWRD